MSKLSYDVNTSPLRKIYIVDNAIFTCLFYNFSGQCNTRKRTLRNHMRIYFGLKNLKQYSLYI